MAGFLKKLGSNFKRGFSKALTKGGSFLKKVATVGQLAMPVIDTLGIELPFLPETVNAAIGGASALGDAMETAGHKLGGATDFNQGAQAVGDLAKTGAEIVAPFL